MSNRATVPPAASYTAAPLLQKSPVLSILALVFGILGVLGSFLFGIGLVPAIAGIVLGFLGWRKEPAATGLWLTGILTGFVGLVVSLMVIVGVMMLIALPANGGFLNR